jgi:outer membrane protein assembly factor BamA
LRQGTEYPLALDVNIDYNKWISYYFYGIGNQSNYDNRIKYTRKLVEFNITAGRGFSDHLVGQFAIGYKTIENSNTENNSHANSKYLVSQPSLVKYSSAILDIRYDTRNSFINPSHGIVFQGKVEFVPKIPQNNVSFIHWTTWLQYYRELFINRVILAMRFGLQELNGKDLPIHVLIPLGSNRTLRGYPLDRFLDKSAALFNTEIRFPIYWRFGGILGLDAGRVWESVEKFSFKNWHYNAVLGLRYYLQTYIVRLDVGFSHETIGLYLNFGHIF